MRYFDRSGHESSSIKKSPNDLGQVRAGIPARGLENQLRVTILIGVIVSALLAVLILALFSYEQFARAFHGNFKGFLISVAFVAGSSILCLSIERAVITNLLKTQTRVFGSLQYLSSFIETSIPTAGMIVGSLFLGPIYTLFTPAVFIYPIEQLNRKFGSQLLISDDVWQTLGDVFPKAIARGDVHVKGREGTIQIYQVA